MNRWQQDVLVRHLEEDISDLAERFVNYQNIGKFRPRMLIDLRLLNISLDMIIQYNLEDENMNYLLPTEMSSFLNYCNDTLNKDYIINFEI